MKSENEESLKLVVDLDHCLYEQDDLKEGSYDFSVRVIIGDGIEVSTAPPECKDIEGIEKFRNFVI